jgi:hypothetical protein
MSKLRKGDALAANPQEAMSLASSGQDFRKHVRFKIDDAATSFSIKGVSTSVGSGHVTRSRAAINLSEGGAMLLLCECVPIGTPVVIRIEIDGMGEHIEVEGSVRWCEQGDRNPKDFHTGVQFDTLGDPEMRKIAKMRDWVTSAEYRASQGADPPQ